MVDSLSLANLGFLFAGLLFVKYALRDHGSASPPGPTGWPLIGNLLDFPKMKEWLTFAKWGEKWGPLVEVSVFGQKMVILNSAEHAIGMLDKKGSIYSDRPSIPMGGELVGWKNTLVLVPYGDRLREYRKMFHQTIGTPALMSQYHSIEEHETHKFLQRLLSTPEDLSNHIRKTAGSIILRISHGYKVREGEDPFVKLADEATEQFALSTAPGGFLVNLVPWLQHLPDWVPGTGFKKLAEKWRGTIERMADEPHQFVKRQMAAGKAEPSFTSRMLEVPIKLSAEREHAIKWSAASMYSGGADTTVASVYALFLALTLNSRVVAKAHEEIDRVVGPGRLPTIADRDNLPYTNAVALEVLRWHAVVPTGVPHRLTEDDEYRGYALSKGSLVIPNIWNMLHDPEVYSDPLEFKPERFLGETPERDPRDICFGFGRRICPGRVLADSSVFISTAMTLAVFDVRKRIVGNTVVEPVVGQTTGTISHPLPFECDIRARSDAARGLILTQPAVIA